MTNPQMPKASDEAELNARIHRILDELTLAVRWQRPSLITAAYRSEITRKNVETRIVGALQASGKPVLHYRVDRTHYDIPIELRNHALHQEAIFLVSNLRQGGGRGYSNAYRALNMHREYLVEAGIKAIFWMTVGESRQIARFAPDFWAFRHLVVDFPELPGKATPSPSRKTGRQGESLPGELNAGNEMAALGCYEEAIQSYRQAVRKHPQDTSIHLRIAKLQMDMGLLPAAQRSLKKAYGGFKTGNLNFQKEHARLKSRLKSSQSPIGGISEG